MTPKLRFSQTVYPAPQSLTVGDLFSFVKEKNKDGKVSNVITNSAEYGLIPQRDFFDKDIAVEGNTSNYTIIHEGDFVYNPRKSASAPYGPFNCYGLPEEGIVSPLYTCLTPKDKEYTPYLLWYFRSSAWHLYIMLNGAQGGARHDRVGMTNQLMKDIPVYLPCKEERDAIASFLNAYDEKVSLQQQKVEALERRKKGLLQKVFSQEIRFKADDGSEFADWEETKLANICEKMLDGDWIESKDQSDEGIRLIQTGNIGVTEFINKDGKEKWVSEATFKRLHCEEVFEGDILISRLPSPAGRACIIPNTGNRMITAVDCTIVRLNNSAVTGFIVQFLSSQIYFKQVVACLAGGTRQRISRKNLEDISIYLPSVPEQQKIADFFSAIDEQIDIEKKRLESMQTIKKGLLQQMFCDGSEE